MINDIIKLNTKDFINKFSINDFERYVSGKYFADDELWDEEGTSRDLYENGRKAMYAETAFTIKDAEFCEDDFDFSLDASPNI